MYSIHWHKKFKRASTFASSALAVAAVSAFLRVSSFAFAAWSKYPSPQLLIHSTNYRFLKNCFLLSLKCSSFRFFRSFLSFLWLLLLPLAFCFSLFSFLMFRLFSKETWGKNRTFSSRLATSSRSAASFALFTAFVFYPCKTWFANIHSTPLSPPLVP